MNSTDAVTCSVSGTKYKLDRHMRNGKKNNKVGRKIFPSRFVSF